MNRPLIIILILLFLAFIFLAARYFSPLLCAPAAAAAPVGGNSCGTWAYDDGKDFKVETNSYYRFRVNEAKAIVSNRGDFNEAINRTVNHLKNNSDRVLRITGLYGSTEDNKNNNSNLGISRANSVKSILANKGVKADQLDVDSEFLRQDVVFDDTLCRGAYFTFYPKGNNNPKSRTATSYIAGAAVGSNLVGKDMTIYFALNKGAMRLNTKERKDMQDIKAYLDAKPSARLNVSGHTDVRGEATVNKALSQKRAQFAAEQLSERFKIPTNRMNIVGYGEERPVDNTNTEEGHQKNRRVEIRLVNK